MPGYELRPMSRIEVVVRELLMTALAGVRELPREEARLVVGGDFGHTAAQDYYIRVDRVDGRTDRFEGSYIVDVEVFAGNPHVAESRSLDIEALLLGYPHVVEVEGRSVTIYEVSQNSTPDELPWEDDEVTRLGATYVFNVKR